MVYTKQRDPHHPSCYTQYSGTTLVVNQKKPHQRMAKAKLLRCHQLKRSIHASIRSHSLTHWSPLMARTQMKC